MKRRILAFFIVLTLTGITIGIKLAAHPAVDRWLRNSIVEQAEKHLGVHLQLGKVERNVTLTHLTLTDVTLRDLKGSGNSISVSRLAVDIDPYAFFRGKVVVRDLKLEGMFLDIVRREDGTVSVDPLFPFWQTRSRPKGDLVRLGFEIENVTFLDVSLSYRDVPGGARVNLDNVSIFLTHNRFDPPDRRTISLGAKEGTLSWRVFPEGRTVSIDDLSGVFAVTPSELKVEKLDLDTGPIALELSGTLPFVRNAALNGNLTIDLDIGKLPWLIPGSAGLISLNGNVGGDLLSPSFRGQLEGVDVSVADRVLDRVAADIYLNSEGCTLSDGRIEYRGVHLASEGDLLFKKSLPFNMRVHTDRYPLYKILEEVGGKKEPGNGFVSADLMINGQLSGGASLVTMNGVMGVPLGGTLRTMEFDLSGRYGGGALDKLLLTAGTKSMEMKLGGKLSGEGPLLDLYIVDSDLTSWNDVPGLDAFGGALAITGTAQGAWDEVRASFDLEIAEPSWERFTASLVQAHVDLDSTGMSMPMLTIKTGSSVLVGRAWVPLGDKGENAWVNVSISDGQIKELLQAAALDTQVVGELDGSLYFSSTGSGWDGGGKATLRSGRVLLEPFDEITVAGNISKGVFHADRIRIVKDSREMEGTGYITDNRYKVSFRSLEPILMEGIRYLEVINVPLGGEISLSGEVSGSLDGAALGGKVDAAWDQVTYDGRTWRSGKGTFLLDGSELQGQGELLDGELAAFVIVELKSDFPFSGTISTPGTISSKGLNDFLGLRIPENLVAGKISVRADANGILTNVQKTRVDGVITDADFTINGVHFSSNEQVPFNYFPETGIRFTKLPLRSGESVVGGTLRIAPDAGIEGNVEGSIDLTGLSFLEPTVNSISGKALTKLQISGSIPEPVLNGSIELANTECMAHLPFDLHVTDLAGTMEIVGNRLHIREVTGKPEGGQVWMSGELFMAGFKPVQGSLQWKAEGVPIDYPEGLNTVNRADISLRFSEGRGFLRGTINMDQGTYTRNVDIDNLIALIGEGNTAGDVSRKEEGEGTEGRWLNLDIEMVTASPLDVDIKLVRGEASGSLHLRGTAASPVLTGRLEMTEGTIEYRGHVFEVTSGSVGFLNAKIIEPSFDFSGRTEVTGFDREGTVTDYTVELLAVGVPEKFKLDLVSSPALSEADIASLLTFGAVGEQAFASRAGLSAAEATLLLTRELKGKLETEVERVTGFDRFTINPSSVSSSGERTTRIQVDKKLSEKFFLTYSTPVLASEEQEVQVQYRITKSLSLVGEQLGERDYGLDLDFTFEIP